MKAKLVKERGVYDLYRIDEDGKRVTFASTEDYKQKLSLKNCQAIERGYDLDELAKNYLLDKYLPNSNQEDRELWYITNDWSIKVVDIIKNFCIELMDDKKFSEDDMRMAYGRQFDSSFPEFLQLLQQTEWDVEIVMQEDKDVLVNDVREFLENLGDKPLLDADGCLILKRI